MQNGRKFEKAIATLYEKMGFEVETNKILKGYSGTYHEIDVYAEKKSLFGTKRILIECKYREKDKVGKEDISSIIVKSRDIKCNECAVFTNSEFYESAINISKFCEPKLKLFDGEKTAKLFKKYRMEDQLYLVDRKNHPLDHLIGMLFLAMDEANKIKRLS